MSFKKIIVIGCPGSGKSTFARALRDITGLPLYHLDMLFWNSDKTTVSGEVFDDRLSNVLKNDKWIIDGNFSRTLELRLQKCDTVFFLDYPVDVCLDGARNRIGKPRDDIPWTETEADPEFMEFIKTFPIERRPKIQSLLKKYSDKNICVFNSRSDADIFLRTFK